LHMHHIVFVVVTKRTHHPGQSYFPEFAYIGDEAKAVDILSADYLGPTRASASSSKFRAVDSAREEHPVEVPTKT